MLQVEAIAIVMPAKVAKIGQRREAGKCKTVRPREPGPYETGVPFSPRACSDTAARNAHLNRPPS